jgi:predicted ferric reductase
MTARTRADLAGLVAAASLLVVVALWWNGLTEFDWSAVGRLTGLLSADLLLLQVLTLARIPFVEGAFGQDRLARWHRWSGFASFDLLLVHIVTVIIGYAAPVHASVISEAWDLVVAYPGMLLAVAGAALIAMVVVTSVRAARRRLRFESWHLLHLYAYLGIGLAVPHQLWTGADFVSSPWATAYWWTLYLTAAGAVVVFRLGMPIARNLRHRLRVDAVVPEVPGITSVYLRGHRLDRLPVRAGQFFLWRFLDGPGWSRANPYSLSAPPESGTLRITVKDLGDGSSRAARLRPGTRVLLEGPYGRFTGEDYKGGPVTMFACGVGVTPFLALLGNLPYRPGEATLVYRARSARDLAFRSELDWYATHRGVRVLPMLGRRGSGWAPRDLGRPTVADVVPGIARHRVYICGPDEWSAEVRTAVLAAGVPPERVHHESFAW